MKWHEAQAFCRRNHTDLASVRNKSEDVAIQRSIPGDDPVMIGLSRLSWIWWADDTHSTFQNFADGHPLHLNKSCAASVIDDARHGKWVENHCDAKFPFMCHNSELSLHHLHATARWLCGVIFLLYYIFFYFITRKDAVVWRQGDGAEIHNRPEWPRRHRRHLESGNCHHHTSQVHDGTFWAPLNNWIWANKILNKRFCMLINTHTFATFVTCKQNM